MCCANCSFRDLILGWARLPLHLSHPVGHLGLCSLGELWVSLASSHFYVFCCLVEFKKKPHEVGVWLPQRTWGGFKAGWWTLAWGVWECLSWPGKAAGGCRWCWTLSLKDLGPGELLLNPPWSDVPRAGVLLQKWGRAGSVTSPCPSFIHSAHTSVEFQSWLWLKTQDWKCPPSLGVPQLINHGPYEVFFCRSCSILPCVVLFHPGRGRSDLV